MSTIFDSIGIDPGIVIIVLLIVVLVLIGTTICMKQKKNMNRQYALWQNISNCFTVNMASKNTMHLMMSEVN